METVIDLSPLFDVGLEVLAGLVLALGAWGVHKLSSWIGLKNDDELRKVVLGAVDRAVVFGKNKAKAELDDADWSKIEVQNALVAHGASYVMSKVPDAVKKFNLTEDQVKDLVLAKLDDKA